MGIILDGTWKNKTYDSKQMNAKQVAAIFGIEEELFPTKQTKSPFIQFELHKNKRKVVKGQQRMIKQEQIPCTFTKSNGGDTMTISYFDQKIPRHNNKTGERTVELSPRKLSIDKKVMTFNRNKDADKIVYMALHGLCFTSPLANPADSKTYGIKDFDKEADLYQVEKSQQLELYNCIFNDPISVVRLRAKGIGMLGIDNMDDNVVRARVSQSLDNAIQKNTFESFYNKFTAPYSGIKGQIMECIDRGIFKEKTSNGQYYYEWAEGQETTGKICTVVRGKMAKDFLVDYMVNNWDAYHKYIDNALNLSKKDVGGYVKNFEKGLKEEKEQSKPLTAKDMSVDQLVDECVSKSMILYNMQSKSVHFVVSGKMDKEPFMVAELSSWVAETKAKVGTDPDLEKKIRKKLTAKANFKK